MYRRIIKVESDKNLFVIPCNNPSMVYLPQIYHTVKLHPTMVYLGLFARLNPIHFFQTTVHYFENISLILFELSGDLTNR